MWSFAVLPIFLFGISAGWRLNVRNDDHQIALRQEIEVTWCVHNGVKFEEGNEIITLDQCESCTCEEGVVTCDTLPSCAGCRYGGQHYLPGDYFTDGCNICFCDVGGEVLCQKIEGIPDYVECDRKRALMNKKDEAVSVRNAYTCYSDGTWYDEGEVFGGTSCDDPECTCHWDGQISCRSYHDQCSINQCYHEGNFIGVGATVDLANGCGECECMESGQLVCDLSGGGSHCRGCVYNNQFYYQGDWFKHEDGCRDCVCVEGGRVLCTTDPC